MEGVFTLNDLDKSIPAGKRLRKSAVALAVALLFLTICNTQVAWASSSPQGERPAAVFASASEPEFNVNLRINASWDGGDIINLDITDLDTGERQQVAIRLSDFIHEGENARYILLQAMDLLGERQSGIIQIENPLFDPGLPTSGQNVGNSGSNLGVDDLPDNLQNIVAEANQPTPPPQTLTPDGTGTVVDNIMTVNNIEFFTVTTDNGSDFFLVVDRQRASNNVYLLNTVTEADLMALAEARGETMIAVPAGTVPPPSGGAATQPPDAPPALTMEEILQAIQDAMEQNQREQAPAPPPVRQGGNSGIVILVVFLLLLICGGIAVWKVLLPKMQNATQSAQNDIEDDEDYDNEHDDGDDGFSPGYESVEVDEGEDGGFDREVGFDTDDPQEEDYQNVHGGEDDEEYA